MHDRNEIDARRNAGLQWEMSLPSELERLTCSRPLMRLTVQGDTWEELEHAFQCAKEMTGAG